MIKKYVLTCGEYCKRFTKAWDYYCAASDAYLAGYRQAREDAGLPSLGEDLVPYEAPRDGEHQLSERTFRLWREQNEGKV